MSLLKQDGKEISHLWMGNVINRHVGKESVKMFILMFNLDFNMSFFLFMQSTSHLTVLLRVVIHYYMITVILTGWVESDHSTKHEAAVKFNSNDTSCQLTNGNPNCFLYFVCPWGQFNYIYKTCVGLIYYACPCFPYFSKCSFLPGLPRERNYSRTTLL